VFQLVQLIHLSTEGGSGGKLESWTKRVQHLSTLLYPPVHPVHLVHLSQLIHQRWKAGIRRKGGKLDKVDRGVSQLVQLSTWSYTNLWLVRRWKGGQAGKLFHLILYKPSVCKKVERWTENVQKQEVLYVYTS
jgi:hypothetical protein